MLQLRESDVVTPGLLACLPETRIGLFDPSTTTRTEPLNFVSGSSHRASIARSREVTTDLDLYTQPDPLGLWAGTNLYLYTSANPVNLTDPLGLLEPIFDKPIKKTVSFCINGFLALADLYRNYEAMKKANVIGADKWYHCMAHCEAASRGLGGEIVGYLAGEAREDSDYYKNLLPGFDRHGRIRDPMSPEASKKDCDEDRRANHCGAASKGNCQEGCSKYLVPGLPSGN